jgi:hypothetical protein
MEKIFKVQGRVVDERGQPVPRAFVALVDADRVLDDLLGAGYTNKEGVFRLSFTSQAFNQDLFEHEKTPDLYVVCSREIDGQRVPHARQAFPQLTYEKDEDLGDLVLPAAPPPALARQNPLPGGDKVGRRLKLDDEVVQLAAAEVAPLVEAWTGWKNLLDGVTFPIVESLADLDTSSDVAPTLTMRSPWPVLITGDLGLDAGEPITRYQGDRRIPILRKSAEIQGLDALKVTIGAALMNVALQREHPEIDAESRRLSAEVKALNQQLSRLKVTAEDSPGAAAAPSSEPAPSSALAPSSEPAPSSALAPAPTSPAGSEALSPAEATEDPDPEAAPRSLSFAQLIQGGSDLLHQQWMLAGNLSGYELYLSDDCLTSVYPCTVHLQQLSSLRSTLSHVGIGVMSKVLEMFAHLDFIQQSASQLFWFAEKDLAGLGDHGVPFVERLFLAVRSFAERNAALYRSREQGGQPAPFDPALRLVEPRPSVAPPEAPAEAPPEAPAEVSAGEA